MKNFQRLPHRERMRQIDYRARQADRQEERALEKAIEELEDMKRAASQPTSETSDKEREVILAFVRLQELAEK